MERPLEKEKVRTTITVNKDLLELAKEKAGGLPLSWFISQLLQKWIDNEIEIKLTN